MEWIISFNDFRPVWQNQPSFLMAQCLYVVGGLCTLKHAMSSGGRWPALWLITIICGLEIELIANFVPDINNFWHSQSPVMLFGKRLPLGIVFFYPCLYYISMVSASLLKLPRFYECLTVGFLTLLIHLPADYIGVKYLHWTWHDSDPNLFERNYWVPWSAFFYHFFNSAVICALYNCFENSPMKRGFREVNSRLNWKAIIFTITLGTPIVFIIFGILYHPLHDFMDVSGQIICIIVLTVSASLVWSASCARDDGAFPNNQRSGLEYIVLYISLHYSFFLFTTVIWNPEEQISVGLHQPIGDCNATEYIHTLLGQVLRRRRYLCLTNYRQDYFDFHCVPEFSRATGDVTRWYTICGTPFKNKTEYICIMMAITIVAFNIFKTILSLDSQKQKERKRV